MSDMTVAQRTAEVAERSQRALAGGDVEGYLACFTEDAVLSDPAVPPMVGHEAIRRGIQALLGMFSKMELLELKLFPVEYSVAFKVTLRFVTANGHEATLESVDVFDVNKDFKIYKGRAYWDPAPLMKLLEGK
jgi:ketosteroid isomerase-like protein